jgi:response regulator NasT
MNARSECCGHFADYLYVAHELCMFVDCTKNEWWQHRYALRFPRLSFDAEVICTMSVRVLIIDQSPERAVILQQALSDASYEVVACLTTSVDLTQRVAQFEPDVIIIDIESPDRDTIENLRHITRENPKPIVMFAERGNSEMIQTAVQSGVSAYIVDGLGKNRVKPILDVAIARFREFQALRNELAEVKNKLADRKVIDKAKGLLIDKYDMTEEEAYASLRKMAMNRNQRIAESARNIIAMLEILK